MDAEAARRWDNISLLALKVEDGARSPGVWAAPYTGEGQETNYPLELSRGTQACRPLDFSPLKCILGFGPPKL